jgi:hypothetical protein
MLNTKSLKIQKTIIKQMVFVINERPTKNFHEEITMEIYSLKI